ncbi:MAG: hypothetical protein ACK4MV_03060 [Beijerinckiaceae bacterium]
MSKAETIAQAPSASDALKASLPGFAARLEKWMPRAATAQAWARRGHEFEPELHIHGHCDPRFDARCVKATQMVMEKYGSYAVAAHLSYLVTEFSLEVQFLTREIGMEAAALWTKAAGSRKAA